MKNLGGEKRKNEKNSGDIDGSNNDAIHSYKCTTIAGLRSS
jgi:hypothetical protein